MSGKLVVKQAFGINPNIKNCLHFAQEHHLAYLCGHQIAVINTESKDQGFIAGTSTYQHQSLGITAFVVNLPKKLIAVAEKVQPSAIITLYDSHTLRKKRLLTYSEIGSSEIRCMAFSEDGKFMLMQGAGPDWNLVLWSFEKAAKVLSSTRISHNDAPVHACSFCPWDNTVILVIGRGILKLFRTSYSEGQPGQLKPLSLVVRYASANFVSLLWLGGSDTAAEDTEDSGSDTDTADLLIGTDTGEILYFDHFEFRGYIGTHIHTSNTSSTSNSPSNTHNTHDTHTHDTHDTHDTHNTHTHEEVQLQPVLCMAPYARGFVVGSTGARVKVYERQEEVKERYLLEDTIVLPSMHMHTGRWHMPICPYANMSLS
jgi:hypothetical protein